MVRYTKRTTKRFIAAIVVAGVLLTAGGLANAAVVGNKYASQSALPCKANYSLTEDNAQTLSANPPRVHRLTATINVYCYIVINQYGLNYGTNFAGADLSVTGLGLPASCTDSDSWYTGGPWFNGYVGQVSCSTPYKANGLAGQYQARGDFWYGDTPANPTDIDAGCEVTANFPGGWQTTCSKVLTTNVLPGTHG